MNRLALPMLLLLALHPPRESRAAETGKPLKVFILAGQSNMEGQAVTDLAGKDYNEGRGTLAALMRDPVKGPLFKHLKGADGKWAERDDVWVRYERERGPLLKGPLTMGFSVYGDPHHFGPELQFGHVMGEALPNQVLLIKTAWGGKSLYKDFRPPSSGGAVGPYYAKMLQQIREALADLKSDFPAYTGDGYELAGFVWYHGWNDGCEPKTAVPEYEANLANLIKDVRRELNAPRLPVVIGELTGPWVVAPGAWATLRQAQAAVAAHPEFAGTVAFVETHDFVRKPEDSPNPGHGHHEFGNAETCFLVGDALAQGMKRLLMPAAQKLQAKGELDVGAMLQPVPLTATFIDPDYYIWCGTMVRGDDGKCHLFYSRWPRELGHYAWVTHSEVGHAVADAPLGTFRHVDVALPARGAAFWDGLCTHNPTVRRFGKKFYLYYTGNTGDGVAMKTLNWTHRNNQRIGVAVADSPNGPWQRFDQPLIAPTPGFLDALCCANPTVTDRVGGGYLIVYKAVGDTNKLPFGGPVLHAVAFSDSPTGPFRKQPNPVFKKEGVAFAAEDPFIWTQNSHYWAIVKDNAGYFTQRGKSTALFESSDGLDWKLAKHALVATTEITWEDGRKQKLNSLERPQLFFENSMPSLLLFACDEDGKRDHSFNIRVPLKAVNTAEP